MAEAERARVVAAARSSAVTRADLVHARLGAFGRRVERALDSIARAAEIGRIGVSFSGGKDSTVTLDLVRRVCPDAPAAFFDSGSEYQSAVDLAKQLGVIDQRPRLSLLELSRYSGWWGYPDPVDAGCDWDAKGILIDEPSEVFVCRQRLSVIALGLRGAESRGRSWNAKVRGDLYQSRDRTWRLCPLATWSTEDVWAYIASRALPYCAAYDRMTALGIERDRQRVGPLLSHDATWAGAQQIARMVEPDTFARLAAEFPLFGLA